ncbi:MAG: cupredoxin domain-containing protein, partial [Candidatus Woesearchaeota archaeon]|nr:cupredoxin domain-containing protein [Candidatus Woesearchaeota archaeon]
TIEVNQGDTVVIKVKSIDVPHGLAIPDYGIRQRLDPGKEEIVEFVADKKGTFGFFCSVSCGSGHRGMTGELVVS